MRANLLAVALLLTAASPAAAADARAQASRTAAMPGAEPAPMPLKLNLGLRPTWLVRPDDDADLRLRPESTTAAQAAQSSIGFSVGPLRTSLGGDGKKTGIAHYHLEGMDLFGGSISGRVDGRGARLYLRWPPSEDE